MQCCDLLSTICDDSNKDPTWKHPAQRLHLSITQIVLTISSFPSMNCVLTGTKRHTLHNWTIDIRSILSQVLDVSISLNQHWLLPTSLSTDWKRLLFSDDRDDMTRQRCELNERWVMYPTNTHSILCLLFGIGVGAPGWGPWVPSGRQRIIVARSRVCCSGLRMKKKMFFDDSDLDINTDVKL